MIEIKLGYGVSLITYERLRLEEGNPVGRELVGDEAVHMSIIIGKAEPRSQKRGS